VDCLIPQKKYPERKNVESFPFTKNLLNQLSTLEPLIWPQCIGFDVIVFAKIKSSGINQSFNS
jgi:hypothetical protein